MQPEEPVEASDVASSPPAAEIEPSSHSVPNPRRPPSQHEAGHTRTSSRGHSNTSNHSHSHSHKPRHQFSHSVAVTTPEAPPAPFLPPTFFKVHGLHQRTLANIFFVGLLIFANVCLQVLSGKPPGLVAILFVNGLVLFAIRYENSANQQRNASTAKSSSSTGAASDQVISTRRVESFSSLPPATVELPSITTLSSQVQESFREAQAIRKRQSHSQSHSHSHTQPHSVARSSTAHGVTFDPRLNTVTVGDSAESEPEEDTGSRELTEEEMSRLCGFGGSAPKPKKEKPATTAVAAESSREDSKKSDSSDEHSLTNTAHKILEEESHTSHGVSHGVLNNRDQHHNNNQHNNSQNKRGSGNAGGQHPPARKASASQKADSSTQTADGLVKKPTSPPGPTPTPARAPSASAAPSSPPGPAATKSTSPSKTAAHREEKTASKHASSHAPAPAAAAAHADKHETKAASHHASASEVSSPTKPSGAKSKHHHEAADMPAPFVEPTSATAVAHPRRATIASSDVTKHAHPEPRADLVPFPPVVRSNLPLCGDTLTRLKKEVGWEITWKNVTASTFNVRCGPDYKKNGFKAPSKENMYDVIAIDIFKSESKVQRITNHIRLPDPREIYDRKSLGSHSEYKGPTPGLNLPDLADDEGWDFEALGVPPFFICNMQAPNYGPANPIWGSAKTDGDNYCLIQYLALNKEGRAALKNNTPAGKLLRFFMNNCPDDKVADRFKGICRVENMDSLSLASFAGRYNAKPFLCRPQQTFYKGPNYVEQFVDVHRFTYLARLGLWNYVMPIVQDMVFDLALVIESREENEMPEQILSAVRYTNLQFNNAVPFKPSN